MPLESRDVIKAWKAKGFELTPRQDHIEYQLKGSKVASHVSHGANHDISMGIEKKMAKQMHLSLGQFREFVSCTMSEQAYRRVLVEAGELPANLPEAN